MAFVMNHLRLAAQPNGTKRRDPTPDLRGTGYWQPVAVTLNGNGRARRASAVPRQVLRLVRSLTRVVLGLPLFAPRG
jgi:hypothetical protein